MKFNFIFSLVLLIIYFSISVLFAQQTDQEKKDEELTKAAQNPIANLMSFPFQNNTNFKTGPDSSSNRTQNILNIQPVIPLLHGRLITRTIFPLIWNPIYSQESGSDFGFGDILFTAFYSPESKGLTWGVGPVVQFPTGGTGFGTGKWSAGASVVALAMPGQWVVGAILNNIWSFAGQENKPNVNFLTFQPFINYNFPNFYFTFSPIVTANWEADSDNQWTVPLGLGVGKLVKFGKLPVNINASYYHNVVTPEYGAEYQLRLLAAVLLPASLL